MTSPALLAGFADPSAASQACFRAVLSALAEPGSAHRLPPPQERPAGCMSGTASIGLALLDTSTPFYVSQLEGLAGYLRFHTGAPESEQAEAQWAFTSADNQGLVDLLLGLSLGSLEYPEAASTLVIQLRQHPQAGGPMGLQGPGIQGRRGFSTLGLPEALWVWRRTQRSRYPLGIDLLFVFEDEVWGLPRSTEILQEDACTSQ